MIISATDLATIIGYVKIECPTIAYNETTNPQGLTDETIGYFVLTVCQYVLNYTRLNAVPEELFYVIAEMTVDACLHRMNAYSSTSSPVGGGGAIVGDVSSVAAGDTTISYSSSVNNVTGMSVKSHVPDLDKIMMDYVGILKRFRRVIF